jgi:hypothetical protein
LEHLPYQYGDEENSYVSESTTKKYFTFALEYAIRKRQKSKQEGLEFDKTHSFWYVLMILIYWAKS